MSKYRLLGLILNFGVGFTLLGVGLVETQLPNSFSTSVIDIFLGVLNLVIGSQGF